MILKPSRAALAAEEGLCERLVLAIREAIEGSRFCANVAKEFHQRWKTIVKIDTVRLQRKKDYCGQHPNECQVNPFFNKPHRRGHWLEGADWVGWNDGLNALLDKLNIEADVWSFNREAASEGRYFIRKGYKRRVDYHSTERWNGFMSHYGWTIEGQFENWCRAAVGEHAPPLSDFPAGTPGLACWTLEEEKSVAELQTIG